MTKFSAFFLLLAVLLAGCKPSGPEREQQINARLGDISFIEKFGKAPDAGTPEDLRISTHLEYVEARLRERKVPNMRPALLAKRKEMLDLLHQYTTAGAFPRNYQYAGERKPCFIDKEGRICAVGYLIEQTSGREIAEAINQEFQYEKILAMNDPAIDAWIAGSGLSKEECAMIQPNYGFQNPASVTTGKAIATGMLGGLNMSLSAINVIHAVQGSENNVVPILGLAGGLGSVVYGVASLPKEPDYDYWGSRSGIENSKLLSVVNIGLGTCSMALATWNLVDRKPNPEKKFTWNVYGYPSEARQPVVGVNLKLKL